MRALLINPAEQTVTEVEHNGDYKEIYSLIECSCFTAPVDFPNHDTLYADDEGLFKPEIIGGFMMKDWVYPIVGKCLILGCNPRNGKSVDAKSSADEIENGIVRWLTAEEAQRYAEEIVG